MLARYHYDEEVVPLSDKRFEGAVVFMHGEFESWLSDLENGCKEWEGSSPSISGGESK